MQNSEDTNNSIAFFKPCDELAQFVSGYHVFVSSSPNNKLQNDIFFPGWANIRFISDDADIEIAYKDQEYKKIYKANLFGPSSQLAKSKASRGIMIGAGLTPYGYASLFSKKASQYTNGVHNLSQIWKEDLEFFRLDLYENLNHEIIKNKLDKLLLRRLKPNIKHREIIQKFMDLLIKDFDIDIDEAAKKLNLETYQFRRFASRYFGFAPKILLRRNRFFNSIIAIFLAQNEKSAELIAPSYFDYSHFVRDCHEFFGMSPQEFIKIDAPLARKSLFLRAKTLGAPVQSLHKIE